NNKHANSKHNVNTNTNETNQKASSTNSTSMTNWTTQKKRNHSNSSYSNSEPPTSSQDHSHTHKNKKKLFITKNRYEVLSQTEQPPETSMHAVPCPEIESEVIAKPPPPIFIKDVNDFPALCTELSI
ncbi:formin-F-like, partial [Aphis craccivora]